MPNILDGGDVEPLRLPPSLDVNPLQLFNIAKSEKRPLFASAPMLAFRQTVAEYGVDLTWTPMILAKEFNRSLFARDSDFTLAPNQPPTIVQFGCNSPLELSRATTLIAPYVNGIGINCGCPQSWACAETLGAALMHKRELVAEMVKEAKASLEREGFKDKKTVSVKIRIHRDLRETIDFIKTVENAGVDFITIHPRLRSTPSSIPASTEALTLLNSHTRVPTISNCDIFSLSSALSHYAATKVDGVMSARGILENPGMFFRPNSTSSYGIDKSQPAQDTGCTWDVVETFMNKVAIAPIPFKLVVHHLSEMTGTDRTQKGKTLLSKDERGILMECKNFCEVVDFLDEVRSENGGLRREMEGHEENEILK
ncbi:FMN-linked oxidoreductase [Glarea lozoyensis ATCC 20868]|uniref:FMN-linked oxidoreductase n=1 Tax=Glarea lozoyensis (strain ATCC 20868 / MF5171) TaxID=1116229 RepID=S3CIH3_GLAL2|nr:FMN-linked oxidoreductase [Glarea lozoyensis ATCC 20868]EPE25064.1 FMN-linked oxidoreductase [Glarea lozoyensis ATCC 20868]